MVDFKALETVVWIARLQSFRAAADKLNTTQPAISVRVAQLEEELGTQLFDRSSRALCMTPPGREVLDYAERLLRLRAEMLNAVADRSSLHGIFKLGVAETIVHTWLPAFLEQVSMTYPKLALEIEVDISTNLRERLLQQKIDLAFLVGPLSAPSVIQQPLCRFPLCFVASPRISADLGGGSLSDLARWPILTFARNTQPYVQVVELFSNPNLPTPRIYASSSLSTLVRMALDSIGIAVIPSEIVHEELASGSLIELDISANLPDLHFVAGWLGTPDRVTLEEVVAMAMRVVADR
ncbi:LysR family transcriptional regulator (plasmid) [Rhizobium sp. CB3090]|uniref:LysR family transcriptional regulator n=1 Tax=Rhizobium sp. CB3090 TaxID=3039156 RepID=UPI0024B0AC13|nr:LysR family transcriptional regulator [Rhizobium sp. CB3090]WFU12197.1 LysR family transcriptional regulator [Rhizobium sp. CB3090]